MTDDDRVKKLRWLCRRGMKELDILLERFVDAQPVALAAGAWPQLEALLGEEDDVLWDRIQSPALATDPEQQKLLHAIRDEHAAAP